MYEDFMTWLMTEGTWQHSAWFAYVTFHDLIQWAIVSILGLTAWGQRKHKEKLNELVIELKDELQHVHEEIHNHIDEDAALHADLGQEGKMSEGKPHKEERFLIEPLSRDHFQQVVDLGNKVHGDNYLSLKDMDEILEISQKNGRNASFVALTEDRGCLVGFRLAFAPGKWINRYSKKLSPKLWPFPAEKIAYFKCNTVDARYRRRGIGKQLLYRSIQECKKQGAKAGIAHIWVNSPGNSAYNYFTRSGGKPLVMYRNYWAEEWRQKGAGCSACGKECGCSGIEMILKFSHFKEI
ncbi:MAG: GNAT family N-acetyltransferase [Candidatus Altiarchaeales archaeon]|nr:GNAT family N-acetyltransferase [Candidatus Altiarchaeales archaeon]